MGLFVLGLPKFLLQAILEVKGLVFFLAHLLPLLQNAEQVAIDVSLGQVSQLLGALPLRISHSYSRAGKMVVQGSRRVEEQELVVSLE